MWAEENSTIDAPGLGSVAAPSAPVAPPVAPLTPQAPAPAIDIARAREQPNDPATNALNFFRDPKRLAAAAAAAAAAQRPDMLAWLKRGHEAQKENSGEALARLIANDKQGAIAAFNANGEDKADSIEGGSKPGLFKIRFANGLSREIDPRKELMTLLTPPQMETALNKEDQNAIKLELGRQLVDSRNQATQYRADAEAAKLGQRASEFDAKAADRAAQQAHLTALTALANARAGHVGSGGSGSGEVKYSPQRFSNQLRLEANDLFSVVDPISKKQSIENPEGASIVRSLAESFAKQARMDGDSLSPAEAVRMGKDEYDRMRAAAETRAEQDVTNAKKSAEVSLTSPSTWTNITSSPNYGKSKTENEFRQKRVNEYIDEQLKTRSRAEPTKEAPKFQEGQRLVNKKDGKTYVVKNGVPVPE